MRGQNKYLVNKDIDKGNDTKRTIIVTIISVIIQLSIRFS